MIPELQKQIKLLYGHADYVTFLALLFLLPFGYRVSTPFLGLWIVLVVISHIRFRDFSVKNITLYSTAPLLFFMIYFLSALFSKDIRMDWPNVEIKLSLLFIPLLFPYGRDLYLSGRMDFFKVFVGGTLISTLICLANALMNSVAIEGGNLIFDSVPQRGWGNYFTYTDLSVFIHPGYLAMYLNLSLAWVLGFFEKKGRSVLRKAAYWITILFIISSLWLLGSKIGLAVAMLIVLWFVFRISVRHFSLLKTLLIISSLILVVTVLSLSTDRYKSAFKAIAEISKNGLPEGGSENGNLVRLWIWDSAWSVIKQKPLGGSGIGKAEILLLNEYESRNMGMASLMKYNAHNQYLETWIAVGIPGLLTLLLLFGSLLIPALKARDNIYYAFILIIISQSLFESFLERFSGVTFFIIFYLIFGISHGKPVKEDISYVQLNENNLN